MTSSKQEKNREELGRWLRDQREKGVSTGSETKILIRDIKQPVPGRSKLYGR